MERERERATERWRWKERGSEARLGRERHHHRAVEDHRRRRNGESQNWRHHLNVLWSKKAREGSSLLRGRGCQQKQKRAEFSWASTSIGSITRVRYRSRRRRRRRRSSFAQPKQSKRLRKMLTKLCAEWFIVARTYKFNIHSFFAVFIGPIAYLSVSAMAEMNGPEKKQSTDVVGRSPAVQINRATTPVGFSVVECSSNPGESASSLLERFFPSPTTNSRYKKVFTPFTLSSYVIYGPK